VRMGYDQTEPKCGDPAKPVACKDGVCRPDYISCLKVGRFLPQLAHSVTATCSAIRGLLTTHTKI
jgi:hypothetical protein